MENATRTKTVFQKVREGQEWQAIESDLAKGRMRATQNNEAARAAPENFPELGLRGEARDIIAKRVGLGSGRNFQKALQVVEEIDRLCETGKTEIAEALKSILNENSINAAHKLLSIADKERERLLELIASDKALTLKEAQKLLQDLNPPETEIQLAEGIKVKIQDNSPISPGLKGEITSLPNSSSAIVLFEDGTREMVDREYIKPALEELPQSLIDQVNQKPRSTTPETPKQNKVEPSLPPLEDPKMEKPKSAKEELDQKQEELGLGERRQSVLPESDRIDELQHSNPTDIDDRPFARPIAFSPKDSQELNSFLKNLDKLGVEDIRVITLAIASRKQDAIIEATINLADNDELITKIVSALYKKSPNAVKKALG